MAYTFVKEKSFDTVFDIFLGAKKLGYVCGFEYSNEYSNILNGKACCAEYIKIYQKYQRKGHCLNIIKQIIESNDCKYFVLSKPFGNNILTGLCKKIKKENIIRDYYFEDLTQKEEYKVKEDLILIK